MDYLYENLGDERFQEFCHSLINSEFPNSQAFPVGQPDGGRDSIVYFMESPQKEYVVFQVKYVRNPHHVKDIHKWLKDIIEGEKGEAEKINKLIAKGAKRYYILTNVKGTAHLDAGSIDKVNKILEENVEIPAICWWRDDLSRKIESYPLVKWSYPELLSGQDFLVSAIFNNFSENKERRENVIKAYLADQYKMDNDVKFRQIDLQTSLLDLFTDVPIRVKKFNLKDRKLKRNLEYIDSQQIILSRHDYYHYDYRPSMRTADFLLHPKFQNQVQRVLLEGGPGQGKSTISQYICQVHRARLLEKVSDLAKIPENHKKTSLKLPFKIDLRDVASWIEKKNPYQAIIGEEYFNKLWNKSLESFLIAHIFNHSQLTDFDTNDFIAVCKLSSVLFVFDGFDEIANLKIREDVIEFINKGINRIAENSKSIQIVITSRPAAFSDAVSFSEDIYPHFELTDVTPEIIDEYVKKWIKINNLGSKDAAEINRLITEKLKMPHLKELAKSPMQLAIFLTLLRTRGESLPNKRTALYDSYVNLFFDRESEKNATIRDNRDLIIGIHQYLGWILHSEAEMLNTSGRIDLERLKTLLKDYLSSEGHETDITESLFDAVKERVCALVSRVQGTFEFEVQPLREYFCARYLYDTAPYSPTGNEKSGTKPEIFAVISRNYYWQNVLRFFAGCFDRGELPTLIHELRELENDDLLKYTNYPRLLTSQILSDYVFTQYPRLLNNVVAVIINGIDIGSIISQEAYSTNKEPILLPQDCGRKELIQECFEQLKKFPPNDYSQELIEIINNNPLNKIEYWKENIDNLNGNQLTRWFEYAYFLRLIYQLDIETLLSIAKESENKSTRLARLRNIIVGGRIEICEQDNEIKKFALQSILDGQIFSIGNNSINYSLCILAVLINPSLFNHLNNEHLLYSGFPEYLTRLYGIKDADKFLELKINSNDEIDDKILKFYQQTKSTFETLNQNWLKDLSPWDKIVESGRKIFGNNWIFDLISVIGASIKSKDDSFSEFKNLDDNRISLCKRVRCARLKSGNVKYWKEQLGSSMNLELKLLILFTWATPKTLTELLPVLSSIIDNLSQSSINKIINGLVFTTKHSTFTSSQEIQIEEILTEDKVSNILKYLISFRFSYEKQGYFIYNFVNEDDKILQISEAKLDYLVSIFPNNPNKLNLVEEIKEFYKSLPKFVPRRNNYHRHSMPKLSIEVAMRIMNNCKEYPRIIASVAESVCRNHANSETIPVGKTAKERKWFMSTV